MNQLPKSNAKIYSEKEIEIQIDPDGAEHKVIVEKTRRIESSAEPDFIKLYTKMWCEFNEIPDKYRPLFLELATRMTYCNKSGLDRSQIVYTGEPFASAICEALGWKQKDSLMKGLRALCNCNAIKKVNRAVYQINPSYAGRGEWKYRPALDRGGVEDLIAVFNFRDKKVDTHVIWADNGEPGEDNESYRDMLNTSPKTDDSASMIYTKTTPIEPTADSDRAAKAAPTESHKKSRKKPKKEEVAV